MSKRARIKKHLSDHKYCYMLVGGVIVIATVVYLKKEGGTVVTTINDSFKVQWQWKSPTTNQIYNITCDPTNWANGVLNLDTGEVYDSQNAAAKFFETTSREMAGYLNGERTIPGLPRLERLSRVLIPTE